MSVNPFHSKYFEDVKCRRHGEAACPSCLSYALSDANAAATTAAAQEREACAKAVEGTCVNDKYRIGNRPFLDTKEAIAQDEMRTAAAAAIRASGEAPKCARNCDCHESNGVCGACVKAKCGAPPPKPAARELALKALRELPLPSQETLAAVDDDDLSGSRPCHLRTTIAQVRSLHDAIAALERKG